MKTLPLVLLSVSLSACSSLLYRPSQEVYFPVEQLDCKPESIFLTNEEGKKIHLVHFRGQPDAGTSSKKKLFFVQFHGNAENLTSHFASLYWLIRAGHDLVIFDYQGFGLSEGDPSPENTVKDGMMVARWAYEKEAQWKPVVLYGQSIGGAVAMRVAAQLNQQLKEEPKNHVPIALVVADSTFHSYQAIGRSFLSRHWLTWIFQPLAWVLLSDRWAPEDWIGQIAPVPLLVIHGDQDRVVEMDFGEKVYGLARDPKAFWKIPGGQHINVFHIQNGIHRNEFLTRLNAILP